MSLKNLLDRDWKQRRTAPESYERNLESSSEMQLIHLKYEHGIGLTWCWFFVLRFKDDSHTNRYFPGIVLWASGGRGKVAL